VAKADEAPCPGYIRLRNRNQLGPNAESNRDKAPTDYNEWMMRVLKLLLAALARAFGGSILSCT